MSHVWGETELRRIAEEALRQADGDSAEAVIVARTGSLTRFANAAIHQNVSAVEAGLRVRVVRGTRVATQATDRLDTEGIAAVARSASELARIVPGRTRTSAVCRARGPSRRRPPPSSSALPRRARSTAPRR